MKSWLTLAPVVDEPTSTTGGEPTTEISVAPAVSGSSSTFRRNVRSGETSMPVRLKGR